MNHEDDFSLQLVSIFHVSMWLFYSMHADEYDLEITSIDCIRLHSLFLFDY